jgi:hypothetical protein
MKNILKEGKMNKTFDVDDTKLKKLAEKVTQKLDSQSRKELEGLVRNANAQDRVLYDILSVMDALNTNGIEYASEVMKKQEHSGLSGGYVLDMIGRYHPLGPEFVKYEHRRLSGKLAAITSILGFIGAGFFSPFNLTGNVIGNLTSSKLNILGIVFVVVGAAGLFLFVRSKRK